MPQKYNFDRCSVKRVVPFNELERCDATGWTHSAVEGPAVRDPTLGLNPRLPSAPIDSFPPFYERSF